MINRYFFAMSNPNNLDFYTKEQIEERKEKRELLKIDIIDLQKIRDWSGQESADLIYNGFIEI